ncbi:MAG TPA: NlpC/P60 family protein, partial [Bacteroidia bacterium]|nr:NlpC/P60 family protein [Bacteroidia bacterium]
MSTSFLLRTALAGMALLMPLPAVNAQLFKKREIAPVPSPTPLLAVASLPQTEVYQQPFSPPSYQLPYQGFRYERRGSSHGGLFGSSKPSQEMLELLNVIRQRAETIATFRLPYVFGGDHPSEGGLDCSGAMKYLLSDIGFGDMPRTSYDQYAWLKKAKTLRHTKTIPERMGGRKGIKPGDLIFWGGT